MATIKTSELIQVLLFAVLVGIFHLWFGDFKGTIYTPKILKKATLTRDSNGIPTITAEAYTDGIFALGFAHAEDRLWQMYIGYKLALGEVSEIFGEQGIEFDKFMRLLNFLPKCQATLATFSDEEKRNLQAYADGVNHYINTVKVLPLEFLVLGQKKFEWKNEYTCLSIKLIEYYLSSDFLREIVRDYLVNRKLFTEEEIEKIFPYRADHFESANTIIKDDEKKDLRKPGQKFKKQEIKEIYKFRKSKAEIEDEEDYARKVAFFEAKKKEHLEKLKKEAEEKEAKEKAASKNNSQNEKKEDAKPKQHNQKKEVKEKEPAKKDLHNEKKEKQPPKKDSVINQAPKGDIKKQQEKLSKIQIETINKVHKVQIPEVRKEPVVEEPKVKEQKTQRKKLKEEKADTNNQRHPKSSDDNNEKKQKKQQKQQKEKKKESSSNKKQIKIEHVKHDLNAGSNNYVFSGKITNDGNPILGNDPHLHNQMPAFWYAVNIKISNKYHFVGVTHPGSSCLFIGQNGKLAWGITIGFADISDFYKLEIEKVNPIDLSFTLDDPSKKHYLVNRTETFYVDPNRTPEKAKTFTYLDSEIGPVLNGYEDTLFGVANINQIHNVIQDDYNYYILHSTFTNNYDGNFKSLMNFHHVVDMKTMHDALKGVTMSLNIVYADKTNIGYHLTGLVPKRKKIGEGAFPTPIEKESDLKIEYIPFDELPHIENPEKGYIVTANNPVISNDYKHILQGGFIGDGRSRSIEKRINDHLKKGKKIDTQFVIDQIINNVHDSECDNILFLLSQIKDKTEKMIVLEELKGFDCEMKGDSKKALIYNVFLNKLYYSLSYYNNSKVINDWDLNKIAMESEERGNFLKYKLKQYIKDPEKCEKEYKLKCVDFFNKVYTKALVFISNRLTNDEKYWRWDNLNFKEYPHLPFSSIPFLDILSTRRVKTNGNLYTPKTAGSHVFDENYAAFLSSNLKYVTHLNTDEFYISIDCGNSGKLFTEHYDDLCKNHEMGKLMKYDYLSKVHLKPALTFLPESEKPTK